MLLMKLNTLYDISIVEECKILGTGIIITVVAISQFLLVLEINTKVYKLYFVF